MTEIVTIDVSKLLAPLPGPMHGQIAVLLNRTPTQCAAYLRRKGNERLFVLPLMIVKTKADIIDWRRARHMRVLRPLGVTVLAEARSLIETLLQPTTALWNGLEMDFEIVHDESGAFPALPYLIRGPVPPPHIGPLVTTMPTL